MKKMNNKGFSLVELIVVVLIMAIIAVALAPQVMKWVENSRKSTDCNNYDSVVSAVNLALANETVYKNVIGASGFSGATLTWTTQTNSSSAAWAITGDSASNDLDTAIGNVLGSDWKTKLQIKRTTDLYSSGDGGYKVSIDTQGTVTRTVEPKSDSVS